MAATFYANENEICLKSFETWLQINKEFICIRAASCLFKANAAY